MSPPPDPGTDLNSWKEIAEYLHVSVRTAQLWERERGLPIHRIPGGGRGRVMAFVDELESWKRSGRDTGETGPIEAPPAAVQPERRPWAAVGLTLVVVCGVIALGYWLMTRTGQPSGWSFDGRDLVVNDDRGREVFRLDGAGFPAESAPHGSRAAERTTLWFGDLDADGNREVLFIPWFRRPDIAPLFCLDHRGRERWSYTVSRTVNSSEPERFTPVYRAMHFLVLPAERNLPQQIVVSSIQYPYYPCQIALLDVHGKPLREYWHAGHIGHQPALMTAFDADGDGISELYLGGISNGLQLPVLVVLDRDKFAGTPVELNPAKQLLGFPPAIERLRVYFPLSCINTNLTASTFQDVRHQPDGLVVSLSELGVESREHPLLLYYLAADGSCTRVVASSPFLAYHKAEQLAGRLDHEYTKDEAERLRAAVKVVHGSR